MKKILIGCIAAAAMTSCITREEVTTDQNSNLGSATINGSILVKSDYTSDTLSNGNTDFNNLGTSGLEGVTVTANYSSTDLDPDAVNSEEMVLNTTTDADGNYSFAVDATGQGTTVSVTFDGVISTDITYGGNNNDGRLAEERFHSGLTGDSLAYAPQRYTVHTESLRVLSTGIANYTVTLRDGQTETRPRVILTTTDL